LVSSIQATDTQVADLNAKPQSGLRGLSSRLTTWGRVKRLLREREEATADLRAVLVAIGQQAGATAKQAVPSIGPLLDQAADAKRASTEFATQAQTIGDHVAQLDAEIARRHDSERQMGFDALYTAAYLQRFGTPAVTSPLETKRDELACFACPATFARIQTRTKFVGRSSGLSFPIGHTGIRYRVGSFHGQPVQQQLLARLDIGTLVVTNQRLAFVGKAKAIAIQLSKLVHVDTYTDALAVFHEGKENADYFIVTNPKQAVFYINWAISMASKG
jgi:hypothetical protein